MSGLSVATMTGSSPLTRGKRIDHTLGIYSLGLIPAHAGKTPPRTRSQHEAWAHPRSRGENPWASYSVSAMRGSSPLTRGKRPGLAWAGLGWGLIPAHAGKTPPPGRREPRERAHPRSRGENDGADGVLGENTGSSPLTRGKQLGRGDRECVLGLIPAHAGKTTTPSPLSARSPAHPRSRGENPSASLPGSGMGGSSPLTRGKHLDGGSVEITGRLIPAHAGKTEDGA